MLPTWEEMVGQDWEEGFSSSGQKFFHTPIKKGFRKKCYSARDLPREYWHLEPVLFPSASKKLKASY